VAKREPALVPRLGRDRCCRRRRSWLCLDRQLGGCGRHRRRPVRGDLAHRRLGSDPAGAASPLPTSPARVRGAGRVVPTSHRRRVRRRSDLRLGLVPWRLLVLTEGLFLVVSAAGRHGLDALLGHLVGGGGDIRVAAIAAGAANLVNNLPAYLALERAVPRTNLLALLTGINIGPLVLVWGSLATLLWRERCRARGVEVSALSFGLLGLVGMPVVLAATVLALRLIA